VPLSHLQKRIIDLSTRVVSTDDLEEFNRIASALKSALREHSENLRKMVDQRRKRLRSDGVTAASQDVTKPD
jgi:hypothetical protein